MHCSCYAANKDLTKLRTKKPVRDRYDIYNSVAIVKLSVTTTGVLQYSKPGIVAIQANLKWNGKTIKLWAVAMSCAVNSQNQNKKDNNEHQITEVSWFLILKRMNGLMNTRMHACMNE